MNFPTTRRGRLRDYFHFGTIPFWAIHVLAIVGALTVDFSWELLALAVGSYFFRMFFVTAGYHRYFAHRTFKTSRAFQLVMAFFAQSSVQRGVLWWSGNHRIHHKLSDTPNDVHSPKQHGLAWAHLGWILSGEHDRVPLEKIQDFAGFAELRWLTRWHLVPAFAYGTALFLIGGWAWVVWGMFVSTVLLWHGTFTINSLTHVWGRTRFPSGDESKNHWFLAFITMGEGWHNNHHYYQSSVNQGFYWWEYDVTFWILRALAAVGIVSDLRRPPARVLELGRGRARPETEAAPKPAPLVTRAAES